LTGIANRRAFEEALNQEWRRALRHKTPLCLLMIDVDYFKRFNDAYGHVAGDQCLQTVARTLARNARRAGEMAARYGGEEFAVLLPQTNFDEALRLAERMCQAVRDQNVPHKGSEVASHVTISVGAACAEHVMNSVAREQPLNDNAPGETRRANPTILVKCADAALYRAKTDGRNRAVAASDGDVADDQPKPAAADGGSSRDAKAA
jgi:diguanylate cyclase (GGDEF)-like protein